MKHTLHFIQKLALALSTLFFAYSAFGQNALDFDGVDDYVISPYNGLTGNSSRTVEAWIKPVLKSTQAVIVDMGLSATGQRFTLNLINGKLRIEVGGSGLIGTTVIPDGNWHHVAVTYDNSLSTGKFALYIDGVQEGTSFDLSTAVNTGSGDLRIGGRVDGTNFFQGAIDEVRVWNKAKTLAEIVADTGAEFCTSQFGLVAYHRFNQATAAGTNTNDTISIDDSGLGNDGRLYGFALSGTTSNWVNGKLPACIPPSCLNPNGLTATNAYGTTADIYWTQSNSGSTFKMEYGPSGFTLGAGTKSVPTNDTVSLTGLTPTTVYDVYVKEICSTTDSSAWTMLSFNTGCGIINTFPYVESFDNAVWVSGTSGNNSGFAIDPCWTANPTPSLSNSYMWGTRTGSTSSSNTGPTTDYSGSGNYLYTEASYGASNSLATVQSPSIDLSSLTVPQLSFQFHMYGSTVGTLMAWAWNGSSYDTVWTISGDQGNAWNEGIVDLSAYSNSITHIVFAATKGGSYSDIAIDQVEVTEAPACPKPTMFNISNITPTSVDLNFISSGTNFEVEFGPTGFTQGTSTTTTILSSGHTISGLNPNTVYDFYIKNDCTDSSKGTSTWVGPITAQTLCSYTNYYFTDWDQLASSQTDYCWTFLSYGAGSTYSSVYAHAPGSSTPQPVSGTKYYRMYKPSSTHTFLVSPEMTDLDQNTLQLRLQATHTVSSSSPVGFAIGTMASLSDSTSFVAIDTVITTQNTWTEFTVLLNNVPSGHRYVVLKAISTSYMYMGIDDLYIESIPACLPPSLGVFSQIQDTSVVLDWLGGDGSSFEIEYGTTGFTQGSGMVITSLTDTNKVIGGLTAQSCYDFYIRGNCSSSSKSPWYGPISVCTECSTVQAPYLENFEDTTWVPVRFNSNQINECWNRTPDNTFSFRWESYTASTPTSNTGPSSGANGTSKYMYTESSYGSNGSFSVLETPTIDFSSLTTPTLSFAYHMYGSTMGNLYVLVSNGTQLDTIHTITGEQQRSETAPWKTAYVDISAYTGAARRFQFVAEKAGTYGDIAIDEVAVDEMPTCLPPATFVLDSVAGTIADFNWTSITNGTSFKMEYGPVGFTQGSSTLNTVYSSSSSARVSGLSVNTSYDIYITDMCDSTSWTGPLTFTTLINDDAAIQHLISPANLSCGDSSHSVEVAVINNGLNPISNVPVTANISGATSTSISTIYSGTIAPGASATVAIGSINTHAGGIINITAYTGLTGDQDLANDTLNIAIEMISAQPMLYPTDSLCAKDSIGQFAAITQTGITYNWYQNQTDVTPFATGDTIDVQPNQTLFVDRSKDVDQLILDAPYTSSQFGNMFKLYIKNDFTFTGFSFVPATSGTAEPIAFFKPGNFVGHETNRGSWTAIDSLVIPGAVANNWYRINFTNPVQFTAGDTVSFYLANKQGTKMRWQQLTTLNAVGDLFLNNADFEYYAGVTGAYFGTNMTSGTPRAVSSIMHYGSNDVCGNSRIAVTMGVNNDTAIASFSTTVNANGADVDFDASASKGHVYQWNYGDGNTGSGVNSSNTYATAGSYKVTLTVTDTVCNTTDTISKTVLANVSISEFGLNETIEVYPNPNRGSFNVDLNLSGGHDVQLVLVNTLGQIVYSEDLGNIGGRTKTNIDVDNLAPGVYYLHVQANGKSATVKISVI